MALEGYRVAPCKRADISAFIETNHYSGSINGCIADYCFTLRTPDNVVVGALFYGRMAMAGQWKRFADDETKVIELRRLCCVDNTPKNAESFFIGATLRWLKKNTRHEIVVSYADAEHNHTGVVYRASNFNYLGISAGAKVIVFEGRRFHDKAVRTKYKGELKPFAARLVAALADGRAVFKKTAGKHTYTYLLRK